MTRRPSNMHGAVMDYQNMYDKIRNWDEPEAIVDGKTKYEEGHYLYNLGYALDSMVFFGYVGESGETERYHYRAVETAYKNLKAALQCAIGIE